VHTLSQRGLPSPAWDAKAAAAMFSLQFVTRARTRRGHTKACFRRRRTVTACLPPPDCDATWCEQSCTVYQKKWRTRQT
jgi:hypothetical protein